MYIVSSVELVQAIQKQPKILAFAPVAARFSSRILGTSAEVTKFFTNPVNGGKDELINTFRSALLPGRDLDKMNHVMIQNLAALGGIDVDEFNPRRFLSGQGPKTRRTNPAAFRAFGGGTMPCPGRHFAPNQILAVVSMVRHDTNQRRMVPAQNRRHESSRRDHGAQRRRGSPSVDPNRDSSTGAAGSMT